MASRNARSTSNSANGNILEDQFTQRCGSDSHLVERLAGAKTRDTFFHDKSGHSAMIAVLGIARADSESTARNTRSRFPCPRSKVKTSFAVALRVEMKEIAFLDDTPD